MESSLTLNQATKDLGLSFDDMTGDWGIVNSDDIRLSTFVSYYVLHAPTFTDERVEFELGELLLNSANDALFNGAAEYHDVETALGAVLSRQSTEPTQRLLSFWLRVDQMNEENEDEEERSERKAYWPLSTLLRQVQANMAESASS